MAIGEPLQQGNATFRISTGMDRLYCFSLQNGGFGRPRKGHKNDKAHPPIHPTAYANNLTGDDKRVYEFITRRFLACCSKDAEGFQTTVDIVAGGESFSATGEKQSTCLPARLTLWSRACNSGEKLPRCIHLRQVDGQVPSRL